jgi:hypothetical protein
VLEIEIESPTMISIQSPYCNHIRLHVVTESNSCNPDYISKA